MAEPSPEARGFRRFVVRVVVAHVSTYLIAGLLASNLLDYRSWWATESFSHFRPYDSPWIAAGPALQVVRGLVFAVVLYPFRAIVLGEARGAVHLWALLVGVGVVSTYAAATGSVEGLVYTRVPLVVHALGLPEVVGQAGAFSAVLVGWYRRPHPAWGGVFGTLAVLALLASLAGVLLGP